ncbi:V-type ATP synthase subunit I [Spirochaetia bacterium]|nr:V-type ATP synthase subunit I [Spirochaetia bacterium]
MIVPMKKASVVVLEKNQEKSLAALRELGVIHLEKKSVSSEMLSKLLDRKTKAENASGILRTYKLPKGTEQKKNTDVDLVTRTLTLTEERKSLQEQILAMTKECSRIEKWGDFNPADLTELTEKGLNLIPYELSQKSYAALTKEQRFLVLHSDKTTVAGLAVGEEIPGENQWTLPERSLSELNSAISRAGSRISGIEQELLTMAAYRDCITTDMTTLLGEIEFESAKSGMEKIEDLPDQFSLVYLSGFVPEPDVEKLKQAAAKNGWALAVDNPAETDAPPTLVKNNAFVRLIQPLFGFLGTIPGYREYDISFSYLIFFCLFFAMIFGDAAYGTLLLIICLCIGSSYKKKSGKVPDAVKLFELLSCCTIVWGTLNGAWFATPYENLPGFLQALVLPIFNSDVPLRAFPGFFASIFKIPAEQPSNTAYWNVQFLCFTVAIIQLVYAHMKNILKLAKSSEKLVAVAQCGWLVMMIGLYFLVLSMLLQVTLPGFAIYLIAIGLGAYFIFAEQKGGNFGKNIGKSFANFLPTFLNAVGSFADIISYIRLFAVGLAGTSIAQSFNSMSGIGNIEGPVATVILKIFAAALILVFGHGLNIVMNALSVIVHGVRLNLLEYAGNHLGMEWSGYAYKPFALKKKA